MSVKYSSRCMFRNNSFGFNSASFIDRCLIVVLPDKPRLAQDVYSSIRLSY